MIELDRENRLSDQLGKATDGLGTKLGDRLIGDRKVPQESFHVVGTGQSNADSPIAAFVFSIRKRLEQHPHFRGRTSLVQIELVEGTIVLSGRLPSYHLKQLLQEAIRLMPGVVDIDNRVHITCPNH
jgi:hypothetical protein